MSYPGYGGAPGGFAGGVSILSLNDSYWFTPVMLKPATLRSVEAPINGPRNPIYAFNVFNCLSV